MTDLDNTFSERTIYPVIKKRIGKFKTYSSSGFEGGVSIFVKKRLLGFLWWVFVKEINGIPVTFNHKESATAFCEGVIGYYDNTVVIYDSKKQHVGVDIKKIVRRMSDLDAAKSICDSIGVPHSEDNIDCAARAWKYEGKKHTHKAVVFAKLWLQIFSNNGKKLWKK